MTVKFLSGCFSFCTKKLAITGLFRGRDKRILNYMRSVRDRPLQNKEANPLLARGLGFCFANKEADPLLTRGFGFCFAKQGGYYERISYQLWKLFIKYQLIDSESEAVLAKVSVRESESTEDWYTRRPDWTRDYRSCNADAQAGNPDGS